MVYALFSWLFYLTSKNAMGIFFVSSFLLKIWLLVEHMLIIPDRHDAFAKPVAFVNAKSVGDFKNKKIKRGL